MAVDPYTAWLGIPPDCLPPDYYDLLGVPADETDPALLRRATEIRAEMVRKHHSDENGELVEKIVGELQAAVACLTDPQGRESYQRERLARLSVQWVESERPPSDFYRMVGQRRFTRFHPHLLANLATMRDTLAEVDRVDQAERLTALRSILDTAQRATSSVDACWEYHGPIIVRLRRQFAGKHGKDLSKWDRKLLYAWLQRSARVHPRQVKAVADAMLSPAKQARQVLAAALFVDYPASDAQAETAVKKPVPAAAGASAEVDLESWLLDEITATGPSASSGSMASELDDPAGAKTDDGEDEAEEEDAAGGFRCPYPDCRQVLAAAYASIHNLPCPHCGRVRSREGKVMAQSGELQKGMERKAGKSSTDLAGAWSWLFRMTALSFPIVILLFIVLAKNVNPWVGAALGPVVTFLMISPFTLVITCETRTKRPLDSELASSFALWTGMSLTLAIGLSVGVVYVIRELPAGASAGVGLPMIGVILFLLFYVGRYCATLIETTRSDTLSGVRMLVAYYVFTLAIVLGVALLAAAILFVPAKLWLTATSWRRYLKWLGFNLSIRRR